VVNFYLNARKVAGPGFSLGGNVDIGLRNFVCLTFYEGPSHRLAIVTAAENHFGAVNDNHGIANLRIPITPDLSGGPSLPVIAASFFARKRSLARNPLQ
jgi:hypothetical protein